MVSHAVHPSMMDPYAGPPPPLARAIVRTGSGDTLDYDYANDPYDQRGQNMHAGVGAGAARKRKASPGPDLLETRRLRRSHEACARCRSKKIKCDSKHPRCSACMQAGTQCHQEDRHRQTLTPRGHVEQIEAQLSVCDALLRKLIPGFSMDALAEFAQMHDLDPDVVGALHAAGIPPLSNAQHQHILNMAAAHRPVPPPPPPPVRPTTTATATMADAPHPHPYPGSHVDHTPSPPFPPSHDEDDGITLEPTLVHYSASNPPPPDSPATSRTLSASSTATPSNAFQHRQTYQNDQPRVRATAVSANQRDIKGQDPNNNDLSNAKTMVEGFGVKVPNAWYESSKASSTSDREDNNIHVSLDSLQRAPRRPELWQEVKIHHPYPSSVQTPSFIYLPADRAAVSSVVDAYFVRLNWHRPVFVKQDFEERLDHLYSGGMMHDPGFICSVYLILALGSLCELNHELFRQDHTNVLTKEQTRSMIDKGYRPNWPKVEELFERALAIKPDLRVTISSLQAMILLQWYLYIERHGRSLWRLVGNMVRLAVELGLHHDPWQQRQTFTEDECRLRVNLWLTILIHDRGTAILLGRPLAIAPADTSTPRPRRLLRNSPDFSDHFYHSFPIMEIQADILCSLYTPASISPEAKMRQAIRILQRMEQWRTDDLPPAEYGYYFATPPGWSDKQKHDMVESITADHGLTLLKFWIAKILLLRVLFMSKDLSFSYRSLALRDAVVTSHNIIVVHRSLVKYPDAAFFVSPMPLHISAMIIIYGVMCASPVLEWQRSLDDVWLALSMLPHLRWRWERKDMQGMHPIISKIAEKVFHSNFDEIHDESSPGVLLPEVQTSEWVSAELRPQSALQRKMERWSSSPAPPLVIKPEQHSPPSAGTGIVSPSSAAFISPGGAIHRPTPQHAQNMQPWPEPHVGLFYPLDQENPTNMQPWPSQMQTAMPMGMPQHQQDTNQMLLYRSLGAVGCQPAQQSFINEENDKTPPPEPNNLDNLLKMIEAQGVQAVLEPNMNASQQHFLPHQGPQHHAVAHMHPQHHLLLHPQHHPPAPHAMQQQQQQQHAPMYVVPPSRW